MRQESVTSALVLSVPRHHALSNLLLHFSTASRRKQQQQQKQKQKQKQAALTLPNLDVHLEAAINQ